MYATSSIIFHCTLTRAIDSPAKFRKDNPNVASNVEFKLRWWPFGRFSHRYNAQRMRRKVQRKQPTFDRTRDARLAALHPRPSLDRRYALRQSLWANISRFVICVNCKFNKTRNGCWMATECFVIRHSTQLICEQEDRDSIIWCECTFWEIQWKWCPVVNGVIRPMDGGWVAGAMRDEDIKRGSVLMIQIHLYICIWTLWCNKVL